MNKWTKFFITFFFGIFGVHKFIEKKYAIGFLYLFTCGLFGFGWLYDCVITLTSKDKISQSPISHTNNNAYSPYEKQLAIDSINMYTKDYNRILADVQCGFKNLDPYLSRYRILLEIYNDMEKLNSTYNLNLLKYDSKALYDTLNTELLKFINNKILIVYDKHSIDKDNKDLIKDLKKIRSDIIEEKHTYPEFSELLQQIQFQIENELNKL